MKHLFSRTLRLTTDIEFRRVFRKARKTKTKAFAVFCYRNDLAHPRLGVVVPKKSIRRASERNTFKRIVREGFRLRQHELANVDIVFLAYKEAEGVAKKELWQQLEKQWENLKAQQRKA